MKGIATILFFVSFLNATGQATKECLENMLAVEKEMFGGFISTSETPSSLEYSTEAIDWEGNIDRGDATLSVQGERTIMLSDEADMYRDSEKSVVFLKKEQLAIINEPIGRDQQKTDAFMVFREDFLGLFDLVNCFSEKGLNTLELSRNKEVNEIVDIEKMIFEYTKDKIEKVVVVYNSSYKLRRITYTFGDISRKRHAAMNHPVFRARSEIKIQKALGASISMDQRIKEEDKR